MIRQFSSNFLTLFLFFILLFLYTKLAGPLPFSVNSVTTNKTTTFDVTGEGKSSVSPNNAQISAGVSVTGSSATDAQNQMNSLIDKVSSAVKALGVDSTDIQTSNYSINPTYDYSTSVRKNTGFSANTNLIITVKDISKINAIIDGATAAGATNVNSLGFTNSDQSTAEMEARKIAIANAKKKAQDIASTAGFRLGNLVNYSESPNGYPRPLSLAAGSLNNSAAPTKIEPGSNQVTIDVTLSYEVR